MVKRNQIGASSVDDQIDAAHSDLVAARARADLVAAEENDNLQSDEIFSSWQRRYRVAELEVDRLARLIATLEADRTAKIEQAGRARYIARWNAAAMRNRAVADMMKEQLPKAWEIVKSVIEAAAIAEIESDRVLRDRPVDFEGPCSIGNPEAFRCRRSFEETILEDRVVDLFVEKQTGRLFADQSKQPPRSVVRKFRQVTYLPLQLGDAALPFYREMRFPRLDDNGAAIFDGTSMRTSHDVLRALRAPRPERVQRQHQVRIEPIALASASQIDGGPAVE